MTEALIDSLKIPESFLLDAEILRKTYEVMFTVGLVEFALKFAFF